MGKLNELKYWNHTPKRNVDHSFLSTSEIGNNLVNAIDKKLKVDIVYTGGSEPPTKRTIEPYRFFERLGHNYVESYCHKRNEFRTFRIDRIDSAKVLTSPQEHCSSYAVPTNTVPANTANTTHFNSSSHPSEDWGIPAWIWVAGLFLLLYFCSKN